jgi:hypothetical protein
MAGLDLRPCPFCAHDVPTLVAIGNDDVQLSGFASAECVAVGPTATAGDPPGHALFLWNQRFGAN